MKNIFSFLFLSVVLVSCSDKNNDYVLSREEMIPIMIDLYLTTEKIGMEKLPLDSASIYFKSVYKPQILKNHNVETPKFDSSFKYYSSSPEDFLWIQTAVADSLKVKHLRGRLDF